MEAVLRSALGYAKAVDEGTDVEEEAPVVPTREDGGMSATLPEPVVLSFSVSFQLR